MSSPLGTGSQTVPGPLPFQSPQGTLLSAAVGEAPGHLLGQRRVVLLLAVIKVEDDGPGRDAVTSHERDGINCDAVLGRVAVLLRGRRLARYVEERPARHWLHL